MKKQLKNIYWWWKFEGRHYHKNFIRGIKNLWNWFPVVWYDRDWDQYFIYEVLIHKLEKQAKYIGQNDLHVDAQRDAEKMLLCARLARMQQEELYITEYYEMFEVKVDFTPTDETKKWFEMEYEIIEENFTDYLYKYRHQHKLINKTGKTNQDIAMEIAINNQKRSHKLLFKIMEENIGGWWD